MLSVGIDVSKEKSTVCGMRHLGEIVFGPFEIAHTESDLSELARMIVRLDDDARVVMEATGIYHLPVATFLREQGLFVSIINPYEIFERSKQTREIPWLLQTMELINGLICVNSLLKRMYM